MKREPHIKSNNEISLSVLETIKKCLDVSYDGLFISDEKGRTIYYNEAHINAIDMDSELLENTTVYSRREMGLFNYSPTIECIKTGKPVTAIYYENLKKIITTSVPVFSKGGKLIATISANRNIEKLEELERSSSEDYTSLMKEIDGNDHLGEKFIAEIKYYRQRHKNTDIVGQSNEFKRVLELIYRIAESESTVLILGETGTGKEIVADEIHANSFRNNGPYIKVNCASIPENLLESELFGYEEGAFTGANKRKIGKFELANKGTLLLDEIGEMDLGLQSKLLRVLQEKEITRLGGNLPINIDTRIIASTNKDLYRMVEINKFREDLYYRLNVIPIKVPTLRARKDDIHLLTNHFLKRYNSREKKHMIILNDALCTLENYLWPGNIRELANLIERIVVTSKNNVIDSEVVLGFLGQKYYRYQEKSGNYSGGIVEAVEEYEKEIVQRALIDYKTTREAARFLKVSQSYIMRRIKKYDIEIKFKD